MIMVQEGYLYGEDAICGNKYRERQLEEFLELINTARRKADIRRKEYFRPDFSTVQAYQESIRRYRKDYRETLGWPLAGFQDPLETPEALVEYVTEDSLGKIYRLTIEVYEGLTAYGLLFLPEATPPYPLVIAQHGGQGTPELCSGFHGPTNYNGMTRRVLKKGFAVFAPQLLLWADKYGPAFDRRKTDIRLKHVGSSVAAIEIFTITRSLDYLTAREDIDGGRIGMIGLSYGGFYALYAPAADERIKVSLSSCFFNNRYVYDREDRIWFNSANRFLDPEVCALICPRPLYIEAGKKDEIFDIKYVDKEFQKVKAVYSALGLEERLGFRKFDGTHELDREDHGMDFLSRWLMK